MKFNYINQKYKENTGTVTWMINKSNKIDSECMFVQHLAINFPIGEDHLKWVLSLFDISMYRIGVWPLHALVLDDLRALDQGFLNSNICVLQNPKRSLVLQFTWQSCINWKACDDQILDERSEVAPVWCEIWNNGDVVALEMGQFAVSDFSGPVVAEPGTQRRKRSGHIELVQW